MDWQPIETADTNTTQDVLLWNGRYVFVGWHNDRGWEDSRAPDYLAAPEDPQPTHWMPFPKPPR